MNDSEGIDHMTYYAASSREIAPVPFSMHFLDAIMGDVEKEMWFHAPLAIRVNYFEVGWEDQEIRPVIDCYVEYVEDFRSGEIVWSRPFQNGRFDLQKHFDNLDSE
jgi:hypothetical protein